MPRMLVPLVVAFAVGVSVAAVLVTLRGGSGIEEAPSGPVFTPTGTAVATAGAVVTPTETPVTLEFREPQLFVGQVIGMRGCDQPIFMTVAGAAPRTRMQVERADDGPTIPFTTSGGGFAAIDGRPLFASDCQAGVRYTLRLVEESSGRELATSAFEAPVFPGRIEVEPASGGCTEIVVTVRGMPAGNEVNLLMAQPAPFADNFAAIVRPLLADGDGFARSGPFRPPWPCEQAAVSLFATAGARGEPQPTRAELLYRIALGPDEPVPSVERWLDSMGR